MQDKITPKKLEKYFEVTKKALDKAKIKTPSKIDLHKVAEDFVDTAKRYYTDAHYFAKKGDMVTAFAALNYAHGFLDAAARARLLDVKDSKLFASD